MGSIHPFDPGRSPAVPDVPPISIGPLSVGLTDLLKAADGLVLPRTVTLQETHQEFLLAFAPVADSARVIMAWAMRFGGVVDSHVCDVPGSPHRHLSVTFDYFGVTVSAFTFIPLTGQEDQS